MSEVPSSPTSAEQQWSSPEQQKFSLEMTDAARAGELDRTATLMQNVGSHLEQKLSAMTPMERQTLAIEGSRATLDEALRQAGGTRKVIDSILIDTTGQWLDAYRTDLRQALRDGAGDVGHEIATWITGLGLSDDTLMQDSQLPVGEKTPKKEFGDFSLQSGERQLIGDTDFGNIRRGQGAETHLGASTTEHITNNLSLTGRLDGRAMAGVATRNDDLQFSAAGVRAETAVQYQTRETQASVGARYIAEASVGALKGIGSSTTTEAFANYTHGSVSGHAAYERRVSDRETSETMRAGMNYLVWRGTTVGAEYVRQESRDGVSEDVRAAIEHGFTNRLSGYVRAGKDAHGEESGMVGVRYTF